MAWQHGNVWGVATAAGAAGAAGVKPDDNDGGVHASGSDARADDDVPGLAPPSPATTACAKVADGGGATGAAGIAPKDSWQTAQVPKPFADWSVEEVCELVQRIGFTDAARVLAENRVDGKTLCSADFDCFLVMKISDGGLGLTPMQKIRLKEEIKRATQHI